MLKLEDLNHGDIFIFDSDTESAYRVEDKNMTGKRGVRLIGVRVVARKHGNEWKRISYRAMASVNPCAKVTRVDIDGETKQIDVRRTGDINDATGDEFTE